MIELSQEQALILQQSDPSVVDPLTRQEYVLIRRDVFERIRTLLDQDVGAEDTFRAQIESAAAAGWDDPALDIYNEDS